MVVTNGLEVRVRPGLDAPAVPDPDADPDATDAMVLNAGRHVYVLAGPITRSGSDWYEIEGMGDGAHSTAFGWVAGSSTTGVPWLLPNVEGCPEEMPEELWELEDLEWGAGLACLGSRQLTFEATLGSVETCGMGEGWTVTPRWLGYPDRCVTSGLWVSDGMDYDNIRSDGDPYSMLTGQMDAVIAPGAKHNPGKLTAGTEPKDWVLVSITGQFDHPAARSCQGVAGEEPVPWTADQIVLDCRATFVIISMRSEQDAK